MKFADLPEELKEHIWAGTGYTEAELQDKTVEELWAIAISKGADRTEALYQQLFGIPRLQTRVKELASADNCKECGISGAWQGLLEEVMNHGHHGDYKLKRAAHALGAGYEHRADTILKIRRIFR